VTEYRKPTPDQRKLSDQITKEVSDALTEIINKHDAGDDALDPATLGCIMNGLQMGFGMTAVGLLASLATFSDNPEEMVDSGLDMLKRHVARIIDVQADRARSFARQNKEDAA